MITKSDAVHELTEGSFTVSSAGIVKYEDNCTTIPTESEIQAKLKELEAEYDAQEYARNRKTDYPDIGDQLDALYHAGVFPANMAARIKETKDKYPK